MFNIRQPAMKRAEALAQLRMVMLAESRIRSKMAAEFSRVAAEAAEKYPRIDSVLVEHQRNVRRILTKESDLAASTAANRARQNFMKSCPWLLETKLDTESELTARVGAWAVQNAAEKAKSISADTKRKLGYIIAEGVSNNDHPDDIAMAIKDKIEGMSTYRANMIARTESHAAQMTGQHISMDQTSQSLNMPMIKEWVCTADDRTRETHKAADGQKIKMHGKFEVGGSKLSYPGDPSGPADEVINCRCAIVYEVDDEADIAANPSPPAPVGIAQSEVGQLVPQDTVTQGLDYLIDNAPVVDSWKSEPVDKSVMSTFVKYSGEVYSELRKFPAQYRSVRKFTDEKYDEIRQADRGASDDASDISAAKNINNAIRNNLRSFSTLYRGLTLSRSDADAILKNGIIKFDSMSSTSISREVAETMFARPSMDEIGMVLKLADEVGMPIGGKVSANSDELEVLVAKGGEYTIQSVKRIKTSSQVKFLVELQRKRNKMINVFDIEGYAISMKKSKQIKKPIKQKSRKGSVRVRIVNGVPCI